MSPYIGRFAPSPSGALHAGSVVASLASWIRTRQHQGRWLLRIEDIDPLRTLPGAAAALQHELQRIGLQWDGPVTMQSTRLERHRTILQQLIAADLAYPCGCSRSRVNQLGGHARRCSDAAMGPRAAHAWRFDPPRRCLGFRDEVLGWQERPAVDLDHPVIWRVDDWPAYQLAVVVDDHDSGVTEVVRGADLLDSTPRQLELYAALEWSAPRHLHVPLVLDAAGRKLSKQADAPAIATQDPIMVLQAAWRALRQPPLSAKPAQWTVSRWLETAVQQLSFELLTDG